MEELSQKQQYELAFHLLPSFTDAEVDEKRRGIEELISKSGGIVSRYGEIKKMRLAYPIKKEQFSNFGHIEFSAPKNTIEAINKNLMLNDEILRNLVIKKKEEKKVLTARRPAKPREILPKEKEIETPETTKELDKKIEEILEKL
ncbi:MAG: 30S ribosomal protein S6 [Candidatus Yanofskybacteria bacterium]|nr:30S ribosomal protein S6 [Candidatus Yanofskybacteria bacterium]